MDLSRLSDADLVSLYRRTQPATDAPPPGAPPPPPGGSADLSKMSDDELMALYHRTAPPSALAGGVEPPSTLAAIGRGLTQGATLGYGDELAGALGGAASWLRGEGFQSGYERSRDETRAKDLRAEQAHPWATMGGKLAGGAVATVPMIAAALAAFGAVPGMALGARLAAGARSGLALGGVQGFGGGRARCRIRC